MQHKIGTRITLEDGRVVEVTETRGITCIGCVYDEDFCDGSRACGSRNRTDHKNIIYKEVK